MDDMRQIERIVTQATASTLPPASVVRVQAEPTVDWVGEEGLHVLIVVDEKALGKLSGNEGLDTLHEVQERLRAAGEDRFAYLSYATAQDLTEEDADSEC